MNKRTSALLWILAIIATIGVLYVPAPAPLTDQEKTAIANEIEWSGYANIMTGKLPLVEFPKNDPIFRIVKVLDTGFAENGNYIHEEYFALEFVFQESIDLEKITSNHMASTREKILWKND